MSQSTDPIHKAPAAEPPPDKTSGAGPLPVPGTPANDAAGPPGADHPADHPVDPGPGHRRGWFAFLREAVGGSRRDFTREPLGKAILLLAIPMVLEMIMESVFAVVDMFWVSKLGADAMATVVVTESLLMILYTLAMGLSMGATAVVARRAGEKNPEAASRAAVMVVWLGIGVAVVIGGTGVIFGPQLLAFMGASPATIAVGSGYTRVMLGGSVTIVLIFLLNAVFRGVGDAALAMRTLWLANGINILLGPFFVFGWGPFPQMGVMGAAVATTIGRGTGVLFQLYMLTRGTGRLRIGRRHLGFDGEAMTSIVRVAGSGILQVFIGTLSWIGLVRVLATFGSEVLAGYGVAIRVVLFALLPSWGMANAAATLVGQNLGAGHPERADQAVWRAARYNLGFLGSIGLLFVIFADVIVGIFTTVPVVHQQGTLCLRIVSAGFLFYAYGMVVTQAFNGAGDTRTPTLINFICFWLLEIPLAYVLSRVLGLGPQGVYLAITIAFCVIAVMSVYLFRRGSWKTTKV